MLQIDARGADDHRMTNAEAIIRPLVPDAGRLSDRALLGVLARLPDLVVVVDAEARLLWANRAAEAFFGRSTASSMGMSGLDLVHPDDLEFVLLSLLSIQTKDRGLPIEVRLRSTDGWRLAELIGAPLQGSHAGAVVLSIRDLTERRGLEVANNDDAQLRSLVHNAATLMMLVSADGIVGAASGALARLLGHDPEEVVGHPLTDLVIPSDHAALNDGLATAAMAPQGVGQACTVEVGLQHLSGRSTIPFELTLVNLLEDPTVGGFVVSGHDLTSRKTIEAQLLSTLSLLSATLDATGDGILVVDCEGAITTLNRKFAELWRMPEALVAAKDDVAAIAFVTDQLSNPQVFVDKIAELYAHPEAESHDVLRFLDGRVFDRYSQPQFVDGKIVGRVWNFRDSTERARLEQQLAHQALHDSLTGLANQSLFRDRVDHALARLERSGGHLAVLFLDLDSFKTVNDSLGHSAGDLLLIGVAERLEKFVRTSDTAARLGGDEFAILLENLGCDEDSMDLAERLLGGFERPFSVEGTEVTVTASIGIAWATPGLTGDQLLRNADLAMYTAKRSGRGRLAPYEGEMHATAVKRLYAEADLRRAIDGDEIVPHYQPIVELSTGRVVAVEALARWHHPVRGLLGADAFIPLAEETGLIGALSLSVFDQACADLRGWKDAGIASSELSISVNLAPHQLSGDALYPRVVTALAAHDLDPASLILEITEGAMMMDTITAIATLADLRALGIRIAVDDFGTGYSSLSYLQRFPIDILKIDKSFVDNIDAGGEQSALPEAIIALARTLHLTSVAEGIEREPQRARLCELGCQLAQGYLFAKPLPSDALAALLTTSA